LDRDAGPIQKTGFRLQASGFRLQGSGFRVQEDLAEPWNSNPEP
jgi:hypothetical protein